MQDPPGLNLIQTPNNLKWVFVLNSNPNGREMCPELLIGKAACFRLKFVKFFEWALMGRAILFTLLCIAMASGHANSLPPFISDPSIGDRMVAENRLAMAFLGRMPIVPGHTLISPKRAAATSEDLTPEEWSDILELKELVCRKLKHVFHAEGFNFAWNEGELAGQSVAHFHLHVLPRKPGDAGILEYEPRLFLYRPGSREISPERELAAIAKLLRTSGTR
jgi:diadenosine tetraphosphate (Ap4A) HIT family hydrolase